ncbi:PhnB protein [Sphingomonas laterariae]|uniref:PhnB protein n=1 Tax=Edaphosphingomonas laterariae TaxID=861865 RepID=A0A239ECJ4_9SPHN|nr:VOC family protein [Sphingomonas laterariae]SNS41664.1 PhnB protein [Sphingomonas laterariae]
MQLTPYISFNGECADAFRFYEQAIGAKSLMMMTHGETPAAEHVPANWHGKIMHAHLVLSDGQDLMGSDSPPEHQEKLGGFSLSLHPQGEAEANRLFDALVAGGSVTMPLQQTFWAHRFGMLVDKFGVRWMINCEKAG